MKTSISDYKEYKEICRLAYENDDIFKSFKKHGSYTTILEHVSYDLGLKYIEYIQKTNFDICKLDKLKENDIYGGANILQYGGIYGNISPSTLRYCKILAEIEEMFGDLNEWDIVEIGGGYGGQCKLLNDYFSINSYHLIDMEEPILLAKKYLQPFNYKNISYHTYEDFSCLPKYNLIISNYALSECDKNVQDEYINKILNRSEHGYIIYNNISHFFDINSYKPEEFIELVKCKQKKEEPASGDNRLFYW